MSGLAFGWRTAVLAVAVGQLLLLAVALARASRNRAANRYLAALLVVLSGVLTPWMIGFAGAYDHWRWLTFAPFSITLAVAPLLWLYIRALTEGRAPARAWPHLVPAGLQFLALALSFLLPEPQKDAWARLVYDPFLNVCSIGAAVGLGAYGAAGLRRLRDYRRRLAEQRSDDARFAAAWLSRAVMAALVLLPVWAVYAVWDAVAPLGYVRLMGLYLVIAAFALYLGVEGWRHAALPFPVLTAPARMPAEPAVRDWRAQGEAWAAKVRAEGWAREPELTLAGLARRLGTNTGYLSRALNEGLGLNFSAFVNGLRSEIVAEALEAGAERDLLALAFEAGFASKASFNRAFQARFGVSPSAWRRAVSHRENQAPTRETEARPAKAPATPAA